MLKSKYFALIGSSVFVSGGAVLVYELRKPRNVKDVAEWKGIKLAKENDDFVWKALFFQKKEELKEKKINTELDLKKHCVGLYWNTSLDNKLVDEVETFCSDALTTRKARIIGKGLLTEDKFLKEEEEFKVAFALNRHTEVFIDLLNDFRKKQHNKETDSKDAWDDYQKFCQTKLEENEDTNLQTIAKVCEKKGWKTATDKIKAEGRDFLSEQELRQKFKELNNLEAMQGNTLLQDIQNKEINNWKDLKSNQDSFTSSLVKWCNDQKVKNLFDEGFYPDIYSRLRTRCTKDIKKA